MYALTEEVGPAAVENHISKILRKLDLASRTEIAAWETEQRLIAPVPE